MSRGSGNERFRLAVEAGADVTQALVRGDALSIIARRVAEALDAWECDLYEYDAGSRSLTAVARWARDATEDDQSWIGKVVEVDDRPGYLSVIDEGACVLTTADDPATNAVDRAAMEARGEVATLAVPLRFRDEDVVGCLALIERRPDRRFDDEDCELVALLAAPVAVAIRNARLFRRQEEQNRHLESLLSGTRAITSTVTLKDSLTRICRTAAEALCTDECAAFELDVARDALVFRAFHSGRGAAFGSNDEDVYGLDDFPSDRAILRRGEVVQESLSDEDLAPDSRAFMEERGVLACLSVPLIVEDEPLGMLVLKESVRERIFAAHEVELARALGEQAATAIRHARLYRRGGLQNQRLAALLETSRVLVSSLDVDAVLGEVRREVAGMFAARGDAVRLLLRQDEAFALFVPGGVGIVGEASGEDLDDLRRRAVAELVPATTEDRRGSRIVVPFVSGGVAVGLLDVDALDAPPDADEIELLEVLASQAAVALANADLYRTLERQAITDGLTGLYNHRYFYERLNQEVVRSQRYGLPLSLLMIDIDDFKYFNDRFGHPTGDLVLVEIGRILKTCIRAGIDLAARYGGEEFVIVLPNTARDCAKVVGARLANVLSALPGTPPRNEAGAVAVGEDIRASVASATLPGVDADARITVSVGVASSPGAAGGPDGLVRDADKALYLAKRLGKNRVEVFDG